MRASAFISLAAASACVEHTVLLVEPGAQQEADFATRCAHGAVVLCEGFDEPIPRRGMGENGILGDAPAIDAETRASGRAALRFVLPSESDQYAAGGYFTNFTSDYSVQFGEGEEFYVQWRQRFSPEWLLPARGVQAWWQLRINEGDRPGVSRDWCGYVDLVVGDAYTRGVPQMIHSCGFKDGGFEPFERLVEGASWVDVQPGGDEGCPHDMPGPTCTPYVADEWMTFQVRVAIGTWYANDGVYDRDSTVSLWVAREGQPSVLVIQLDDLDLANEDPVARYGKLWFLPWHVLKDPTEVHAAKTTWIDELIVSRERIADPR